MLTCPICTSLNIFIEKSESNPVFICRECGENTQLIWGEVPSFEELKQAMFDAAPQETIDGKIAFLNALKINRPFWDEAHQGNRKYAEYYNLYTVLRHDKPSAISTETPQAEELPSPSKDSTSRKPSERKQQPVISANGGRKNVSSSRHNSGLGKPVQKGVIRGTQKGTDKPSTQKTS